MSRNPRTVAKEAHAARRDLAASDRLASELMQLTDTLNKQIVRQREELRQAQGGTR